MKLTLALLNCNLYKFQANQWAFQAVELALAAKLFSPSATTQRQSTE